MRSGPPVGWRWLVGVAAGIAILAAVGWTCGKVDTAIKTADCESRGGARGTNAFGVEGCYRR